jgi:hypothetical protein
MDNFNEDNIRQPDEVVKETLIEDTRSDFEKQMDEAIYLSIQEISQQNEINTQYEEQLIKSHSLETDRRLEVFKDFLFNITKIGRFDKEIQNIYYILEPIIDAYCKQYIQTCELEEETYDKIFNTLKKIRVNKLSLETLKTIILRK